MTLDLIQLIIYSLLLGGFLHKKHCEKRQFSSSVSRFVLPIILFHILYFCLSLVVGAINYSRLESDKIWWPLLEQSRFFIMGIPIWLFNSRYSQTALNPKTLIYLTFAAMSVCLI